MDVVVTKATEAPDALPFSDLDVGAIFRLDTGKAVYMKVRLRHEEGYKMVELMTGHAYPPSRSMCLELEAEVRVKDW